MWSLNFGREHFDAVQAACAEYHYFKHHTVGSHHVCCYIIASYMQLSCLTWQGSLHMTKNGKCTFFSFLDIFPFNFFSILFLFFSIFSSTADFFSLCCLSDCMSILLILKCSNVSNTCVCEETIGSVITILGKPHPAFLHYTIVTLNW